MENNENNVQNQEKKQSKGLSAGLVIIMLIAVLIIGIGGGYLLSKNDQLFNKNENQTNNTNTTKNNTENEKNKSNNQESSKDVAKIKVDKDELSFEIPNSWKDTYKVEESTDKFGKQYTIKNKVNGKEVTSFGIAINTQYAFGNSSWVFLGYYNDKKVYTIQNFVCRENDGNTYNENDYQHEKEVAEVIKTIKTKDNNQYNYITVSTDEFSFKMPRTWDSKAYLYEATYKNDVEKLQIAQDENAKYYRMEINTEGKLASTQESIINAFTIMITEDDTYLNSSWTPIGKYNGKNVLVMQKFVCRDGDGNKYSQADYDLEKEINNVVKSIIIK